MSRLIRDTGLIEAIKKWQKEAEPEESRVMEDIICLIDDQPTAYDVEAVVEELNAKGNEFFAKAVNAEIKGENLFAEICKMAASAVYESADIVKRGGRND